MSPLEIFELAASERDDEPAYFALLREGSCDQAIALIREAIARDDVMAMGFYGVLLFLGRGIERNHEEAAAWFSQGARRADILSQVCYGICLANGHGTAPDQQEAARWLYEAGLKGQPDAISLLSDVVGRFPGVVGRHFTVEQYFDLMARLRRPDVLH